jgi:hypothetical protein
MSIDAGEHMCAMHLARARDDRRLLGDGLDTPGMTKSRKQRAAVPIFPSRKNPSRSC